MVFTSFNVSSIFASVIFVWPDMNSTIPPSFSAKLSAANSSNDCLVIIDLDSRGTGSRKQLLTRHHESHKISTQLIECIRTLTI
mmetsp:Transcript_13737/g.13798  ORF Transcript_13737/g.13798 Transcript_13737/m.13798 type:complete len:84 (+) Transcript_13737:985-1236(+)